MRILINGINYYPELISTGKYTGELASWLAEQGWEVRVVTAPPYYPQWKIQPGYSGGKYRHEVLHKVGVYRCPLWVPARPTSIKRILHLLSFAITSLPVILAQIFWKPDIVLCIVPSLFSAPAALLAARLAGARSWIHIQDFELDAAFNLQMMPGRRLLYPMVEAFEKFLLTHFDDVSTISEKMRKRCLDKGLKPERVFILPNWVDTSAIYPLTEENPLRSELGISPDQVVVLYHGNMGRKQGLGLLLEAAKHLEDQPQILFVLCGDGAARPELEEQARGLSNVKFLALQPVERLNALVNLADIHILPQLAGAADLVMPSKLTGMLASGKAIIACAKQGTQIEQVVKPIGRVVLPENVIQLSGAICSLANDPQERLRLGLLAREYAENNLDREKILSALLHKQLSREI